MEAESDARKRKRTSHACDSCRHRKVRCDGRQPCATCSSTGEDCLYGAEAIPKSKSDLILDVVLRSENMLRAMSGHLHALLGPTSPAVDPRIASSPLAFFSPPTIDTTHRPPNSPDQISNAILPQFHSSTTESILAWPHFKDLHGLRRNYRGSVFQLESQRAPFRHRSAGVLPYMGQEEVNCVLSSFERNVNFWYPTLSRSTRTEVEVRVLSSGLEEDIDSCLALLVMALGCASELIRRITMDRPGTRDAEQQHRWQLLSGLYFDLAFRKIYIAQAECSTEAVQCLFYTALFFAFLQRPIQAWSFISAAATKCRLLLSYSTSDSPSEKVECLRRIFWSCYILESDYLAELAALPHTGIAEIESSIPLPGQYHTHASSTTEEESSLYFLACISMRRLLNRVHDLLYARNNGVASDINQFPPVVAELDHQLNKWKDLLPSAFHFDVSRAPTASVEAGFLRQRYLTCKSVIYRPYLTLALSLTTLADPISPMVYEGCRTCLEACCLHAQNLNAFPQTVMIDTWICSLSMASVMLIALATAADGSLRICLPEDVTEIGPNLTKHLVRWMQVPGQGVSPSVLQSVRLIEDASTSLDEILRR